MDTTIDPRGDVFLLLSSGSRLLVSSKILSTASAVFAVMLSPHFLEGCSLSTLNPTEVPLPEDVPAAIETICNILHFRHDLVESELPFDKLYDIALVADKYDLALALGPWREVWLRIAPVRTNTAAAKDRPEASMRGGKEAFLRYVFADRDGFLAVTKEAILWGDERVEWGCEALPDMITKRIFETRIEVLKTLIKAMEYLRLLYQAPGIKCSKEPHSSVLFHPSSQSRMCDDAVLGSLVRHCSNIGIFPRPPLPYKGLSIGGLAKGLKSLRCYVNSNVGHDACDVVYKVEKMTDLVLAAVRGLEVANFKRGGSSGGKGTEGLPRLSSLRTLLSSRNV